MAGATQLGVYNKALRWLEARKLASLTENREPRYYLDDEWEDAVGFVLRQGYWNHSIRLVQISADSSQIPNFGYQFVFTKPSDWIRTYQIADNESFNPLMRRYEDLNNVLYADISPLYFKYVSSDPNYGWNIGLWTPGFVEYLGIYLAKLLVGRIKQEQGKIEYIDKEMKRLKAEALASDAMDMPPQETNYNTWVMSRAPRGSVVPYGFPPPGD